MVYLGVSKTYIGVTRGLLKVLHKATQDPFKLSDAQRLFKGLHKGYESALNSLICMPYVDRFAR